MKDDLIEPRYRWKYGCSHGEVAEIDGSTEAAVHAVLWGALKKLRIEAKHRGIEGELREYLEGRSRDRRYVIEGV